MWFNGMVLREPAAGGGCCAWKTRRHSVGWPTIEARLKKIASTFLNGYAAGINGLKSAENSVAIATVRAILAHLYLAWIHPFGDGNGRTARLVEFQIFLGVGMPTVACHLLSNHYNHTRSEYYSPTLLASKTADVLPSFANAVQGLVDQLDRQIKRIREYQHAVVWKDHVYEHFRDKKGSAAHRHGCWHWNWAEERGRARYGRSESSPRNWVRRTPGRRQRPSLAT